MRRRCHRHRWMWMWMPLRGDFRRWFRRDLLTNLMHFFVWWIFFICRQNSHLQLMFHIHAFRTKNLEDFRYLIFCVHLWHMIVKQLCFGCCGKWKQKKTDSRSVVPFGKGDSSGDSATRKRKSHWHESSMVGFSCDFCKGARVFLYLHLAFLKLLGDETG